MTIKAVLFDFSGTLFRLEHDPSWLTGVTDHRGDPLDVEAQAELMRRMTAPVTLTVDLDDEHLHAWHHRDLDPTLHRKVYLEVLRQSGIPRVEQAKALYGKLVDPAAWTPYPDAGEVLRSVSSSGISVGVLSNIAFDIRPAFAEHGLDAFVDEFVLSYEVGAIKPDPEVFRIALDRLGVAAEHTLMVGDSEEADGGAARLGCAFALVDPLPTAVRTDGLLTALREHSVL
ncbi:HAD family hydrolase [Saccharomonospora cyanea]|uniref:Haloacid dehalogenase superfamily enzyme, subfamily IA n=1 Tax=Saccharomonospora cyanea NA-134 TaxID=882082 RepID=H5XD07_9PSEU|nr:HAD family hydrolase [Saccharomonospora cyanea]EHR63438.1 haloacid dehalogenase superfamily enzyme, subfamily IA [Saccharomonospora cyanea NA-134]